MNCPRCADRGAIRVEYHSGEPFDIALCTCSAGVFYHGVGDGRTLRQWLGGPERPPLGLEHRIGWVEDFDDSPIATEDQDFLDAGRLNGKPKL
jgi:hypothetical protein